MLQPHLCGHGISQPIMPHFLSADRAKCLRLDGGQDSDLSPLAAEEEAPVNVAETSGGSKSSG